MADKMTVECVVFPRDSMDFEIYHKLDGNELGIDFFSERDGVRKNTGGILLTKEGAKQIRDFIDEHLEGLDEGDND
jgi:hypothetical protein